MVLSLTPDLPIKISRYGEMGLFAQPNGIYNQSLTTLLKLSNYHYTKHNVFSVWVNGQQVVNFGIDCQMMWENDEDTNIYTTKWVSDLLDDMFARWLEQPKDQSFTMRSYTGDIHNLVKNHLALGVYSGLVDNLTEWDLHHFIIKIDKPKYGCEVYAKKTGTLLFSLEQVDSENAMVIRNPAQLATASLVSGVLNEFTRELSLWYKQSGLIDAQPERVISEGPVRFINPTYLAWLIIRGRDKTGATIPELVNTCKQKVANDYANKIKVTLDEQVVAGSSSFNNGAWSFKLYRMARVLITDNI